MGGKVPIVKVIVLVALTLFGSSLSGYIYIYIYR